MLFVLRGPLLRGAPKHSTGQGSLEKDRRREPRGREKPAAARNMLANNLAMLLFNLLALRDDRSRCAFVSGTVVLDHQPRGPIQKGRSHQVTCESLGSSCFFFRIPLSDRPIGDSDVRFQGLDFEADSDRIVDKQCARYASLGALCAVWAAKQDHTQVVAAGWLQPRRFL
jgi:hypothetical protein